MSKKQLTTERIIQAALNEFSEKGYENSSTNIISERAGISKGLVFKYFSSKKKLYLYLIDWGVKKLLSELEKSDLPVKTDPFEKIIEIIFWKGMFASTHPRETKMLLEGLSNPPKGMESDIQSSVAGLRTLSVNRFFSEIDFTRFSEEYSREDVLRNISYAIEGLQTATLRKGLTLENLQSAKEPSINFLKIVIKGMEKHE
ncbi:MAG TPA: hypothetical protein DD618_00420 [Acholeplasmatales bacterium]|nr:hypothetical protein [Acholeplasmatales bacterium]